ncbi:hypothetical protein ABFU65_21120 [Xanthomonas campestris pv. raphani]|uniref:hypothetical protein n=1 Tax=Xanthomonas campestris TaxID=339 RepID=UPI0038909A83
MRKAGRNFCKGHPCPLQKRRASLRAALRVVSAGLAAAVWGPGKQTAQATATATATARQQQQQQQKRWQWQWQWHGKNNGNGSSSSGKDTNNSNSGEKKNT